MKILLAIFLLFCSLLSAQPTIEWQKTYGGTLFDEPYRIQQTSDGGYIVVGKTSSPDGDVFGHWGNSDVWVLKLDNVGSIVWKRALGGTATDICYTVVQTHDGGYFLGCFTSSTNYDVTGNHGGDYDGWVVKLSSTGNIEWKKTIGGSGWDDFWCAKQTTDNGFILVGKTDSNDGVVPSNYGTLDFWVVKLDEFGNIQWSKVFGGSGEDYGVSVIQTDDGGYLAVGQTASTDGDVTNHHGNIDLWVIKLSDDGALEWQKTYGGSAWDTGSDVLQAADEGFVIIGSAGSNDGDVTGHHGIFDFWVIKTSNTGELLWQKAMGGTNPERARGIVQSIDGGYIILGDTQSSNGDVVGNHGTGDFWLVKLSATGQLIWQRPFGGTLAESGFGIDNTNDNGFIMTGYVWSTNGELTGQEIKGKNDFWIVKLSPESISPTQEPHPIHPLSIYPNPAAQSISLLTHIETGAMTVRISDLLGREMLRKEMPNDGKLDISALPKGLYIVHAVAGDGSVFRGNLMVGS